MQMLEPRAKNIVQAASVEGRPSNIIGSISNDFYLMIPITIILILYL